MNIMKTLKKVEIVPVYVELISDTLKQDILYISDTYKTMIHLCLCGCGEQSVLPIHSVIGWQLIKHENDKISITPSILNNNCPNRSHYIITKNIANFV
jgi:hypothetical protein